MPLWTTPLDVPVHALLLHYRGGVHGGTVDDGAFTGQDEEDLWALLVAAVSTCTWCLTFDWSTRDPAGFLATPFTIGPELHEASMVSDRGAQSSSERGSA